ncbi:MAG: hypothetical protein HN736_02815 [Anaerolineae bacterium]|jgi:hypothetical protein|nr:hypothetical protein [Anaerolineae bacterium]MBT3713091.1 hypothetical protein [Anaerolineae bacterium]MBT4312299.1 hypothetical protein [Anaerolineae bacterium]MBT4458800.1 hypothetical protein [Anaerolineae bacterium]MBT4841257.1 hypothetical protein [Anaerolineae bacterium]
MKYNLLICDLNLIKNLIQTIDQPLTQIIQESMQVNDADSFGYFDRAEHITGLGFTACQTYITSVYGYLKIEKRTALSIGPTYSESLMKVQIINHAANYWKYNSEWTFDKNKRQRKYVEDAFETVGFPVSTDYPLSGILTEMASPDSVGFEAIIEMLEIWRDELCGLETSTVF